MAQAVFTMLLCEKCDQPYEVVYQGDSPVTRKRCLKGRLSSLPLMVIYNILEFMHHDWFVEVVEPDSKRKGKGSSSERTGNIHTLICNTIVVICLLVCVRAYQ